MNKNTPIHPSRFLKRLEPAIKVICVVVCLYFVLNILFLDNYSLLNYIREKNKYQNMKTSYEKIEETNKDLEHEIERLKNDPFYIETIARRDYRMVKKGESVYIFRR